MIIHIDSGVAVTVSSLGKSFRCYSYAKKCLERCKLVFNCQLLCKPGFVHSNSCPENDLTIKESSSGISSEDFNAFVDTDSSLECHGIVTDEDIYASVRTILTPA